MAITFLTFCQFLHRIIAWDGMVREGMGCVNNCILRFCHLPHKEGAAGRDSTTPTDRQTDRWTDGQTGLSGRQTDGRTDGRMDRQVGRQAGGQTYRQTDGRTDGRTDGQTD